MSSTNRSSFSAFEEQSADLVAPVRERLTGFCEDAVRHARFLNTLSLMEHIGSRKIMTSQSEGGLSQESLKHLAEETRHAYFFKRAAERLARHDLDYSSRDTIAATSARMYMGRLDAAIAAGLPAERSPALAYLYMSLIVEFRAVWFYRLYQAALTETRGGLSLTSVLAEEELHLSTMLTQIESLDDEMPARIAAFSSYEDARFRALWAAIERECVAETLAAE